MLICAQCGTCPVCRQSLSAADEAAAADNADSEMMPSSSDADADVGTGHLTENLPIVTVAADDDVPQLSPDSVIEDVEYFDTEPVKL